MEVEIQTNRFGAICIEPGDIVHFPCGIVGMEQCRNWVLLAESESRVLGWLQSTDQPDIALAVVSPRQFVPDYQFRVSRRELAPLRLERIPDADVLVVVSMNENSLTLNLKAPIVIHLRNHLGCQVVANDEHPVQFELTPQTVLLRKSA